MLSRVVVPFDGSSFANRDLDAIVRRATVPVLLLRGFRSESSSRQLRDPVRRILVPIDESAASRLIFDTVETIAERGVSDILLLRVVAPVSSSEQRSTRDLVAAADHELSGAAVELGERTQCDVDPHVIVAKHPAPAIVDFAKQYGADLIAMTTHGRGASRLPMGSVASRVMHDTSRPLLLSRPQN